MKDVYVTDHKLKGEKFLTHSETEDLAFFNYKQSLADYKSNKASPIVPAPKRKYEKGSLAQRLFDPMAGAKKDANGTLIYEMADNELSQHLNEEKLRRQFDLFTN